MQLRSTLLQVGVAALTGLCLACVLDTVCVLPALQPAAQASGLCPRGALAQGGTLNKLARLWARSTGASAAAEPSRRRRLARLDRWACVPLPDPPRVVLARFPFSGADELSNLLAERAHRNEFRCVPCTARHERRCAVVVCCACSCHACCQCAAALFGVADCWCP